MEDWDPQLGMFAALGGSLEERDYNLAPIFSMFLRREINKDLVEVTGGKVNRSAG